jgi:ketosteroid isomerase-like protein
MLNENVEIVRRNIEAFNRGDLDALFERVDADAVIADPPELPDAKVYRGPEGARESLERFLALFDRVQVDELEEILENGEVVLAGIRFSAQGKGSGVEITQRRWDVLTMRDGKVLRWAIYLDRAQALDAAGLSG